MRLAAAKLPVHTKFVMREEGGKREASSEIRRANEETPRSVVDLNSQRRKRK